MISATEARDRGKAIINDILEFINNIILFAIDNNREYCIVTLKELRDAGAINDNILKKVYDEIVSLGYIATKEIDADKGPYLLIDWAREPVKENPYWVERSRWNGEKFYECSGCGSVAAAEKSETCPHCKCKMRQDN